MVRKKNSQKDLGKIKEKCRDSQWKVGGKEASDIKDLMK